MSSIQQDVEDISSIPIVPKLLEVICRTTGMGFAAIARVTEEKWVACSVRDEIAFGLEPGGELKLETTICHEIRQNGNAVIIDHVDKDETFYNHHTPALYGFQSYISVPIYRKDGVFFGTLCAIDPKPNKLNTIETVGMFNLFADLISFHLNAIEQVNFAETKLLQERKTAELREQFIAILGHDLLTPVGAVLNVAQLLLRMPMDERTTRLAHIVQDSSYRMKGLIENILDFARGRLGEGIVLNCKPDEPVEKILNQVVTELQLLWPGIIIETRFNLIQSVCCDGKRLAQLFSNLLGNALTHGKKDGEIMVEATSANGGFTLSIMNAGEKIPDAAMARLFHPFSRGEVKPGQQGLGLGLYIASEIARAHGGIIDVVSTDENTCFTLRMPAN
ncbi:GAF domain-containing sensor histidine kinase [Mucilaginibacter sp.]|uniref:GAF domain-containing sensor histidine kinase n=1 Tax=Mucilaginibacter sp. TaxID=1882438 RepID=UPI00262B0E47|nr:GAF domain-containing sensor histidine kinase [Mucilaginibacter sp.]MDB4920887.1 histidine kinase [Mucilaginibacter sp.]